jgi:hypothetical protein
MTFDTFIFPFTIVGQCSKFIDGIISFIYKKYLSFSLEYKNTKQSGSFTHNFFLLLSFVLIFLESFFYSFTTKLYELFNKISLGSFFAFYYHKAKSTAKKVHKFYSHSNRVEKAYLVNQSFFGVVFFWLLISFKGEFELFMY